MACGTVAPMDVPVIDISAWVGATRTAPGSELESARALAAEQLDRACRGTGAFLVTGHGLRPGLLAELESASREFFALDTEEKSLVSMDRGGRAWRGWFPLGGELTSGVPDHKEGIYFGRELDRGDPRVAARVPLHGPNLFPGRPGALRPLVLEALGALETLGRALLAAMGSALGLGPDHFDRHVTRDPVVLMRVFHYPAVVDPEPSGRSWGVGEHTDYGLLTLLHQDHTGGLEVHTPGGWVEVKPVPGALVCNLGDMLERMTASRYRATPHRVRTSTQDRISIPFFLDPSWDTELMELPLAPEATPSPATRRRWDGTDLSELRGTYGEYLVSKVSKVFPALRDDAGI